MLGRGATSVVYLAEKTGSGKRYAVKVSICDREKLRREAFLLQKFSYPGIPCAVELLESGTKSFLVMEAVNGKSIGQRMRKGERFSSREILKTGIALSGILCYLHAQNPPVFYRDLKPDNVMITERGEIYLVDFGAAGTEETGVEVRYGTRGYAAPEQYNGKCDARSDLYALGALLAAMAKHAKKRQKRGLWRVMEKCMQKKPEERYASAREVKKALRRLERKQKGRKTLRIFAVFAFLTGGAAAVASRMPWGQFPAADEWEEQGDLWFCGNPVEEGSLPNYQKAREAFLKADHLSQAGRVEQELVEYCLADDAAREKMQMEPLLAEFYDDTQQEPEKEKRCRRYLAVAGMYFSFSEELARENDTDAMRKGIEVLERPQARIWRGSGRRLSGRDWRMRAILAENPGMGKENRTGARRVFSITNGFCAADRMETGGKICSGPQSWHCSSTCRKKQNSTSTRQQKFREWRRTFFISRSEKDGRKQDEKKDHMRNDDRIPGRPGNRSPCGDTADDRRGRKCGGKRGIRS